MPRDIGIAGVEVRFEHQLIVAFLVPCTGVIDIDDAAPFQGTIISRIITRLATDRIDDPCRAAGRGWQHIRELVWGTGTKGEGGPEAIVTNPKTATVLAYI